MAMDSTLARNRPDLFSPPRLSFPQQMAMDRMELGAAPEATPLRDRVPVQQERFRLAQFRLARCL